MGPQISILYSYYENKSWFTKYKGNWCLLCCQIFVWRKWNSKIEQGKSYRSQPSPTALLLEELIVNWWHAVDSYSENCVRFRIDFFFLLVLFCVRWWCLPGRDANLCYFNNIINHRYYSFSWNNIVFPSVFGITYNVGCYICRLT